MTKILIFFRFCVIFKIFDTLNYKPFVVALNLLYAVQCSVEQAGNVHLNRHNHTVSLFARRRDEINNSFQIIAAASFTSRIRIYFLIKKKKKIFQRIID